MRNIVNNSTSNTMLRKFNKTVFFSSPRQIPGSLASAMVSELINFIWSRPSAKVITGLIFITFEWRLHLGIFRDLTDLNTNISD